jgi:hypothetical protein
MIMRSLARILFGLRAMTAIFAGFALFALLRPPGVPSTDAAVAGLDAAGLTLATPARASDVSGIVSANIFSASRRAPASRYRPFGAEPEVAAPPARLDAAAAEAPSAPRAGVPQFFGTVVGPRGTFALLRLDASTPDAQLYREGDSAGGYRVVTINEQSVVLSGPRGRIELRLIRPGGPTP